MKLEQIPCKALAKAKSVFVFPSHLVGCTGKKAVLLDREQNLIHTIEGLSYVYFAAISPDESQLLLISNEKYFYVVDLHSFEKRRIAVKAPWELLADTRGCWSSDGASVYIPVYRGEVSTLRNYRAADPSMYEDVLSGKYVLRTIQWVPSRKAYFLCGYGRQEKKQNYFIWYDGAAFTAYPVQEPPGTMIFMAKAEEKDPSVTMISNHGCFRMSPEGQILEKVEHPSPKDKELSFFSGFHHLLNGNEEKEGQLLAISEALDLERIPAPDRITKYSRSSDGAYGYLASDSGFYLLDGTTGEVLASVPAEHGIHCVAELSPGLLALSTWTATKLYRISK